MNSSTCIWCSLPTSDPDVEHVFPAALGCPDHLVLPGSVVCRSCNTKLAHLDQAVADEFDVIAFLRGIRRKGRRPPQIHSRGNVFGTIEGDGPAISFNLESYSVASHACTNLAPYRGRARDIWPHIERDGSTGRVSYDVPFGQGPKFVRGIVKVAFSAFAFLCGANAARSSRFDGVRSFARQGSTHRHTLITPAGDDLFTLAAFPPWSSPDGEFCIEVRIGPIQFLVDLSNTESLFSTLEAKAREIYGPNGWSVLPSRI